MFVTVAETAGQRGATSSKYSSHSADPAGGAACLPCESLGPQVTATALTVPLSGRGRAGAAAGPARPQRAGRRPVPAAMSSDGLADSLDQFAGRVLAATGQPIVIDTRDVSPTSSGDGTPAACAPTQSVTVS